MVLVLNQARGMFLLLVSDYLQEVIFDEVYVFNLAANQAAPSRFTNVVIPREDLL